MPLSLLVCLVTAPVNVGAAPRAVVLDCAAAGGAAARAGQVAAALCIEIAAQIEAAGRAVVSDPDAPGDALRLRLTVLAATATTMRARIGWRWAGDGGEGEALGFRVVDREDLPPGAMRQFARALVGSLPEQLFSKY